MAAMTIKYNFFWMFSGNFVYGAGQWGMLIIIAKATNPEMVGRFSLALAITAPIIMFCNLNLKAALATDVAHKFPLSDYLLLRILMMAVAFIIILLILTVIGYPPRVIWVTIWIAIAKIFESFSDLLYGFYQQHERMDIIAKSLIVKSVLSLVFLTLGVLITHDVLWGAIGLAAAWGFLLVTFDLPISYKLWRSLKTYDVDNVRSIISFQTLFDRFRRANLKTLVLLTIPLGLATLFNSLLTNVPRYFVERSHGEHALGIFAALVYIMIIGARIITALGEATVPKLSRYYQVKDLVSVKKTLYSAVMIGVFVGLCGIIIAIFMGDIVLKILYTVEYAAYRDVFLWIMLAAAINYIVLLLQYNVTSARYFIPQPVILFFVLLVLTILCSWLVPLYGIAGAAKALVLTGLVHFVGITWVTNRIMNHAMQETIRK